MTLHYLRSLGPHPDTVLSRLLRSVRPLIVLLVGGLPVLLGLDAAFAQTPTPPSVASNAAVQVLSSTQAVPAQIQARAERAFRGDDLRGKDGPMSTVGRDLATLYYQHEANGPA